MIPENKKILGYIFRLGPCIKGSRYLQKNRNKRPYDLWRSCENGGWMWWLLGSMPEHITGDDHEFDRSVEILIGQWERTYYYEYDTYPDRSPDGDPVPPYPDIQKKIAKFIRSKVKYSQIKKALLGAE